MQASQTQQKLSSKDIVEDWAGTVFWNDIWEKSLHTEVEEAEKEKQAAVDAAQASSSDGPEVKAAPATGVAFTNMCAICIDLLFQTQQIPVLCKQNLSLSA